MEKNGEVHIMRECEWNAETFQNVETYMARINFQNESEEQLIKAITNSEVFGFIVCDVHTPAHIQVCVFSKH